MAKRACVLCGEMAGSWSLCYITLCGTSQTLCEKCMRRYRDAAGEEKIALREYMARSPHLREGEEVRERLPQARVQWQRELEQARERRQLEEQFRSVCSQVQVATDDGSYGFHGYVDALVRRELEGDRGYDAVLACGPRPMLRNVARAAEDFGVRCLVSMEERMGCGVGACLVCACDMADGSRKHVCKDGPVFDSREVNWDV